jgi:hypothetical protein
VPKVTCIKLGGSVEVWFGSNDHLPPHFHVEKVGRWLVKVHFRRSSDGMIEVVWAYRGKGPTGKEKRAIVKEVEAHRAELEEEWCQKVCLTEPGVEE